MCFKIKVFSWWGFRGRRGSACYDYKKDNSLASNNNCPSDQTRCQAPVGICFFRLFLQFLFFLITIIHQDLGFFFINLGRILRGCSNNLWTTCCWLENMKSCFFRKPKETTRFPFWAFFQKLIGDLRRVLFIFWIGESIFSMDGFSFWKTDFWTTDF